MFRNNVLKRVMAMGLAVLSVTALLPTANAASSSTSTTSLKEITERYVDAHDGTELADSITYSAYQTVETPQDIDGYRYLDYEISKDQVYTHNDLPFIQGYPDKTVKTENFLTRAEAVTIFYRLYDSVYPTKTRNMLSTTFSDVNATDWYYTELETLYDLGIVDSEDDGKFRPNDAITRAELAVLAARFDELDLSTNMSFSDVTSSHWAYRYINAAADAGWVKGYSNGTFRPDASITRVEAITLVNGMINRSVTLERLKELGIKNPYTDLVETYWGYCEVMEATVAHAGEDWHDSEYNDGKYNVIIEKFVDTKGNEIADSVTTTGKAEVSTKEIPAYTRKGYITYITYEYTTGDAVPSVTKTANTAESFAGDTITYTMVFENKSTATDAWKDVKISDELPEDITMVDGSLYIDGVNSTYKLKDGVLTATLGDIEIGKSVTVKFSATINEGVYNKTIYNTVIAEGSNGIVKDTDGKKTGKYPATDDGIYIAKGETKPTIEKTVNKSETIVDDKLTYSIVMSNEADAEYMIENAVMNDTIPDDFEFIDGSVYVNGKASTYSYNTRTRLLSVELGDLEPADSVTVNFSVTVSESAYGKTIYNTAVLTGDNIVDTEDSDDGVKVTDGETMPDLTKTANVSATTVDSTVIYTMVAENLSGATVAIENAYIEDELPEGTDFVYGSVTVDGNPTTDYTYKNGVLTVNLGTIEVDATVEISFAVTVNSDAYGKVIKNTAVLKGDNSPDTTATDTGVTVGDGKTKPELTKSADATKKTVGEDVEYTIIASNGELATVDIENAYVEDTIPAGLKFNTGSVQVNGKATSDYSYDSATRLLTVRVGNLVRDGESVKVTFVATVTDDAYGATIVNTAILKSDNSDDTEAKDDGIVVQDGVTKPYVEKTNNKSGTTVKVTDRVTYTGKVGNDITAAVSLKGAKFEDVIPVGVTFDTGSVQVDGKVYTDYSYDDNTRLLTVNLGEIAPDTYKTVTFTATVNSDAYGKTIENLGTVVSDNGDTVQDKDDGFDVADGSTDISIEKLVSTTKTSVGSTLNFTMKVTNASGAEVAANNVVVTDVLSEYLTFNGTVQVDGVFYLYTFDSDTNTLSVNLGTIEPNETKVLTIGTVVNSSAYGKTIENVAIATADNGDTDKDNCDTVTVDAGKADGSYGQKTVSTSTAKPNDTVTYSITIGNGSAATAAWSGVTITDVLPEGVSWVGNVTLNGKSTTAYNYTSGTRTLTLTPDDIAIGEKVTYTFDVKVDEGTEGMTIFNVAVLHDPTDNKDYNLPDTGFTVDEGETDPIITKTASSEEVNVGDVFDYTITIKNGNNATTSWKDIVLTDVLPAGLTVSGEILVDNSTCIKEISGNSYSIYVGDLDKGASAVVTIPVLVTSKLADGDFITNTATAKGKNGEATATDKGVTIVDPIDPTIGTTKEGFTVEKTTEKTYILVDSTVSDKDKQNTYTITVSNNTGGTLSNVKVKDTFDLTRVQLITYNNVYVDGILNTNYSISTSGTFTLELGDMEDGESHEITIVVQFKSDAANTTYSNFATAETSNGESARGDAPDIEVVGATDEPTGTHYAVFGGYADGSWQPDTYIALTEAVLVGYRSMSANDTKVLSGYANNIDWSKYTQYYAAFTGELGRAAAYFIGEGVLTANDFATDTKLTEQTGSYTTVSQAMADATAGGYWVDTITQDSGYLRIWASGSQLNAILSHVTGSTGGYTSTQLTTRYDFAKMYCVLSGRDLTPDTNGLSIQSFSDSTAKTVDVINEVSNGHVAEFDASGNERWLYLI